MLGPEMAAPISWAPGHFWFVLQENLHAPKLPRFRGGGCLGFFGEGRSADFVFMGAGIFLTYMRIKFSTPTPNPRIPLSGFLAATRSRIETLTTVRAKINTELILKRAGPVIFKNFLLELIAFRPIPVISPARGAEPENYWKR